MANARFDNLYAVKKVDLQPMQTSQTVRVNVRGEVDKILACSVQSIATTCECLQGEGVVNGRTNVKILYLDQTGDVCSANCNADFANTVQGEIVPNAQMQAFVTVLETKSSAFGNVITVEVVFELACTVYVGQQETVFVDGDLFVKRDDKQIATKVDCHTVCGEIEQQLQTAHAIQRVLLADSVVSVSDFSLSQGVATVQGKAMVELTYFSQKLCHQTFTFDFSQEFVASSLSETAQNAVWVDVKNTKIKLDIVEDEQNDLFTAEIVLCLNVLQTHVENVSVILDAYDKGCDLAFARHALTTVLPCGNARVDKKVSAVLPQQIQGEVVCASNKHVVVSSVQSADGGVNLQGLVCFDLLTICDEGYVTTPVQMPFDERLEVDFVAADCVVGVEGCVKSVAVAIAGELKVDAQLQFNVVAQLLSCVDVIVNVEEIALQRDDRYAIEISIANKGDTLWDLAKNLRMSQEEVLAVNPEISSPLQEPTKIVAYNKL